MTGTTMQLLHEHQGVLGAVKDPKNHFMKVPSLDNFDVKSKTSDGSVMLMNPVASGDNVTTGYNSAHKLKEELPSLIPCCEGKELQISEELVRSGLSAISVKHDNNVMKSFSMSRACEIPQVPPGLVKHRNSFRSLHRPDLKRVSYLRRMSPDELETLFQGYANLPRSPTKTDNREDSHRLMIPPDENILTRDNKTKETVHNEAGVSVLHPLLERRPGIEDVPAGMRLHGAIARLYTSVLAGAKAGDQPEDSVPKEEYDVTQSQVEIVPEDEVPYKEELQIILPPRYDEVNAGSSNTIPFDILHSLTE